MNADRELSIVKRRLLHRIRNVSKVVDRLPIQCCCERVHPPRALSLPRVVYGQLRVEEAQPQTVAVVLR
jgi:hypothetical protein